MELPAADFQSPILGTSTPTFQGTRTDTFLANRATPGRLAANGGIGAKNNEMYDRWILWTASLAYPFRLFV